MIRSWWRCSWVCVGCVVGAPLRIAIGRFLWDVFAGQISTVALPTVPAGTVVIITIAAIALAGLAAMVPRRLAARTRTSGLLRTE